MRGIGIAFLILSTAIFLYSAEENDGNALSIGLQGGILNFIGSAPGNSPGILGEVTFGIPITNRMSLALVSGFGQQKFSPQNINLTTQLLSVDLSAIYQLPLSKRILPFAMIGAGAINFKRGDWPNYWDAAAIAGGGLDIRMSNHLGLRLAADYRYTTGKDLDGISSGKNDSYVTAKAGLNFRFTPGNEKAVKEKSLASGDLFDLILKDVDSTPKESNRPVTAEKRPSTKTETSGDNWLSLKKSNESLDMLVTHRKDMAETIPVTKKRDDSGPEKVSRTEELVNKREEQITVLEQELEAKNERLAVLRKELSNQAQANVSGASVGFEARYQNALALYNSRRIDEAVAIFQSLLAENPTHRLAANCQYWLGEAAFTRRNYQAAIDAFEKTLQYPNSPKEDDAIIMLGVTYRRLGDLGKANQYFSRLLEQLPESEYVPVAKKYSTR